MRPPETGSTAVIEQNEPPPDGSLSGLTWAHFLNDGAANFLPGVLPVILVSMSLPVSLAGAVMAALLLGQGLQPVTGWLADRIGRRALITFGLAGSSLGGALVGLVPTIWLLVPVLVLIGISNSCFHPPAMAAARHLGGNRQGRALSILLVGGEIGRGLWPLLASVIVTVLGLKWIWLLCIPGLISAVPLYHWTPELPHHNRTSTPIDWRRHRGPLLTLVSVSSLRSLMIIASITFLPILWQQQGSTLVAGASVITTILIVGIIGNLAGGHFSDRFGNKPIVLITLVLSIASLAGIVLASGAMLWLLLSLFGIAVFATLPVTVLIGQDILPENRALGSGFAMGFSNAMAALGVSLLGPVAGGFGVHTALWVAVAGGALALVLALQLPARATPPAAQKTVS